MPNKRGGLSQSAVRTIHARSPIRQAGAPGEHSALAHACPKCGAAPGERCWRKNTARITARLKAPHSERRTPRTT